jgi:TonB family protein
LEPRPGVNAEPKPLGGVALFDEYIDNNLRYPLTGNGRQVVKIEFTVSLTGELESFQVLRSPDDEAFQQEAIRVLSEGPKWSPAIEDGIPVESRESVRVVFRP